MHIQTTIGGFLFRADMSTGIDASISTSPYDSEHLQPSAFGLPFACAAPFTSGDFTASVDSGASINCSVISSLCAHSNGTHTECIGHVLPGRVTLGGLARVTGYPPGGLIPAILLSVRPETLGDSGDEYAPGNSSDRVISFHSISRALDALASGLTAMHGGNGAFAGVPHALLAAGGGVCLRTIPNTLLKRSARWSRAAAPYITPAALSLLLALGARHIAVDLPSLDREDDGGELLSHRMWWSLPQRGEPSGALPNTIVAIAASNGAKRLVTELAFFPDTCEDGIYLLNIAVAPIDMDAAPSRLTLHTLTISINQ